MPLGRGKLLIPTDGLAGVRSVPALLLEVSSTLPEACLAGYGDRHGFIPHCRLLRVGSSSEELLAVVA